VTRRRAVLALGLLLGLAACTGENRPPPPAHDPMTVVLSPDSRAPAPAVPGAKPGGTITVLLNSPFEHLDPARTYISRAQLTNLLLQRTLTSFRHRADGKLELVGDLATDTGQPAEGGRVWTYKLREGLRFEDGSAITSADVAYGIARSFSPELPDGPTWLQQWLADSADFRSRYSGPYDGGPAMAPGVSTPDRRTVVLRFARPRPDVPFAVALGNTTPVPRSRDTREQYDRQPVATGPYRIERYDRASELVLVRNPYWVSATDPIRTAYPDRFVYVFGQTPAVATERILAAHGADRAAVSLERVPSELLLTVAADNALAAHATVGTTPYVAYLKINTERVTDIAVRRALNCAFNRDGYIKTIGGLGIATPATTILSPIVAGYQDYNAYDCGPTGDPARAREMLGNRRIPLRYGYRDGDQGPAVAAFLKTSLAKAGFDLITLPIDPTAYFSTVRTRDNGLDIYVHTWGADWPTGEAVLPILLDGRTIAARGNSNTSYFSDTFVNSEIDRIDSIGDLTSAARAWGALDEAIMRDHAPLVPVYYDRTLSLNGARVGGLRLHAILGGTSLENAFVR
jgi:peptide/nickel transport system substrate-binding protein